MRIRIPRRILLLGILLCALALVASAPHYALAKPYGWNDPDPEYPSGDGDGPVVKATGQNSASIPTLDTSRTGTTTTKAASIWKVYLTALRLGYGWRVLW